MQGINKGKHVHLVDALLQIEKLLSTQQQACFCLGQAADYREQLDVSYQNYERILTDLALQIEAYEVLFNQVKVHFLGKKLKELKKEISVKQTTFLLLQENIRQAYGT